MPCNSKKYNNKKAQTNYRKYPEKKFINLIKSKHE